MHDETPKRRPKISYRVPKAYEGDFERMHRLSGMSVSAFLTDSWRRRKQHSKITLVALSQIRSDTAKIKDELAARDVIDDDIKVELQMIRTALMSLMGQRS